MFFLKWTEQRKNIVLSLISIGIASGAILAGIQIIKKTTTPFIAALAKPALPSNQADLTILAQRSGIIEVGAEVRAVADDWIATVQEKLNQLDERAAHYTQTRFDRWLYKDRKEHLIDLAMNNPSTGLAPMARTLYREVNLSLLASALMIGAFTLQPWLVVPALAVDLYLLRYDYRGLRQALFVERRVNADVLFAVLDTVAIAAGILVAPVYLLIYAIILPIILLTRILKMATEDHARQNLTTIFGLHKQTVWVVKAGIEVEIPLAQVQAGDLVAVHAGETVPVDGVIRQGMATIDQHILTGEAQPAEKGIGEPVFATTLVLNGKLCIEVEKAGDQTVAAQIVQILERTTDYRTTVVSRTQQLADRVALPLLCTGAIALHLVGVPGTLAVLNSSTALLYIYLLGHLGVLNFLNRAAYHGILIKDGRALEQMSAVDTVVFDKTGTLTLEQPTVVAIHLAMAGADEAMILAYAAAAEHRQQHPIAQAILQAAAERRLALPAIDQATYKLGYGIEVMIEGVIVRVGSARFMALHQLALPAQIENALTQSDSFGHSLVLVAIGEQVAGAIELQPTLRPEAKAVVAALRQRGVKTCHIISGDQEAPTRRLAEALGMDSYSAQTLPEQKAEIIARMQAAGKVVCYIGDGINDAIALKSADISISLRGASSVAVDTAQVILMRQNLKQLTEVFDLAKDFDRHMKTCFRITLTPGIITLFGAFFLHFGMISSVILNQLGLWTGVVHSMSPVRQLAIASNPEVDKLTK